MKWSILFIVFVVVVGYNLLNSQPSVTMSDVAMENVEALADNEWIPGKGWVCSPFVEDDVSQENYSIVIYCGDCNPHSATNFDNTSHCTYTGMYD